MAKAKVRFDVRKRDPRPCKRKGGIDSLQTDYEVFMVIHAGKKVARKVADGLNAVELMLERIRGIHRCVTCGHRRGEHAMDLVGEHFCEHDGPDECKCVTYVGVVPPSYAELVWVLEAMKPAPSPTEGANHAAAHAEVCEKKRAGGAE